MGQNRLDLTENIPRQAFDGGRVEEVGTVDKTQEPAVATGRDLHLEIELDLTLTARQERRLDAA